MRRGRGLECPPVVESRRSAFRVEIAVTEPSFIEVKAAPLDRWSTAPPLREPDALNRRSYI